MPRKKKEVLNKEPMHPEPEEIQLEVKEPEIQESIEENLPPEEVTQAIPTPTGATSVYREHETESPKYVVEERRGESGSVRANVLPKIICGVCEFCGPGEYDHSQPQRQVIDWTVTPETQLGKCPLHYRGVKIRCSYCPMNAEWAGNIRTRTHHVFESPWNSKELIIVCSDMSCRQKHEKRAGGGRI